MARYLLTGDRAISLTNASVNSEMNGRMSSLDKISDLSLGLSAMLASMAFFYLSQWQFTAEHVLLIIFVLLPYLICWLSSIRLLHANRPYGQIAASFSVVVLLFTGLTYATPFFGTSGSTSALVFIAVPLYILVGTAVIPGITNLVLLYQQRHR